MKDLPKIDHYRARERVARRLAQQLLGELSYEDCEQIAVMDAQIRKLLIDRNAAVDKIVEDTFTKRRLGQ